MPERAGRVLVMAPVGRDAPVSANQLQRAGIQAEICADFPTLMDQIALGAGAVLVAEEGLFGHDLSPLAHWITAQPPWSDLPFVVLTSHHENPRVTAWRRRLVDSVRNISLLERPVQAITLTTAVLAALRARSRQLEVQQLLEGRERAAQQLEELVAARTAQLESANRELHRQMDERARIEESLRQAQKMEAIGQLTGGIAHDFNNLLMVIDGGLDMIERQQDAGRRQRLMDGMRQAAGRGTRLTRALLAFSRRQSLQPQVLDLAQHVGAMRELLERSLRGDINVTLAFAPGLWPVEVDPGELELVLLNLAVNARDAMPQGGQIEIRAVNAPAPAQRGLHVDCVALAVSDSGTGMSPEVKARAFDPFFTTKDVGKGSGLGLAQVYGFAQQSGGLVVIDSEEGVGTTVTLYLPRSTKSLESQPQPGAIAAGPAASNSAGCVLLVEDDNEVAVLVSEMLGQLGYQVLRTESAAAALGALANQRQVDVVFSDVMMPGGMDGLALAREIRLRRPHLPVLLTSGNAEAARAGSDRDGVRLLAKPYRLEELAAALDDVRQRSARRQSSHSSLAS